jgi:hypothetical protein
MNARWPLYRIVGFGTALFIAVGHAGLWWCKRVEEYQGLTEPEFMRTGGRFAVWVLSAIYFFGLFVLLPLTVCLYNQARVPLPGPRVPGWIAWPVRVVVAGFCLVFIVLFVMTLIRVIRG